MTLVLRRMAQPPWRCAITGHFEMEINTYASLNINLPVFTPVVDITDPIVETVADTSDLELAPETGGKSNRRTPGIV